MESQVNVALFGSVGITLPLRCLGERVLHSLRKSAVVHVLGQDAAALEMVEDYPHVVVHIGSDEEVNWKHQTVQVSYPPWKYRCHPQLVEYRLLLHRIMHHVAYSLLFGEPAKVVAYALRQTLKRNHAMLIDVERNADDIELILKMMS